MVFLQVKVSAPSVAFNGGQLILERKEEWSIQSLLDCLQNYKNCEEQKSISQGKRKPEENRSAHCDAMSNVTDGSDWANNYSACPSEPHSGSKCALPQIESSSGPPGHWFRKDREKNTIPEKIEFQGQPSDWTDMIEPWHCRASSSCFTGSMKNWILFDPENKLEKSRCQKSIETPIQRQREPTPELDASALETKLRNAEDALKKRQEQEEAQVKAEEAKADAVQAKAGVVQAKAFAKSMENAQRPKVTVTENALRAKPKAATEKGETEENPHDGRECKQA